MNAVTSGGEGGGGNFLQNGFGKRRKIFCVFISHTNSAACTMRHIAVCTSFKVGTFIRIYRICYSTCLSANSQLRFVRCYSVQHSVQCIGTPVQHNLCINWTCQNCWCNPLYSLYASGMSWRDTCVKRIKAIYNCQIVHQCKPCAVIVHTDGYRVATRLYYSRQSRLISSCSL